MVARSWSLSALALLGLGFAAPAFAKPPDLPNDPRVHCEADEVQRIGVDFSHPTADGQPTRIGYEAPPTPERRYSNGNPLLRSALFGIHPLLALMSQDVLHCDDDEPFPVLELFGEVYDAGEVVLAQQTPSTVEQTHAATPPANEKVNPIYLSLDEAIRLSLKRSGLSEPLYRPKEMPKLDDHFVNP